MPGWDSPVTEMETKLGEPGSSGVPRVCGGFGGYPGFTSVVPETR